jgi:predicted transcriptional regulator
MQTQGEAAGEIGVSRALFQRWEAGKVEPRPAGKTRRKLEAWLNGASS